MTSLLLPGFVAQTLLFVLLGFSLYVFAQLNLRVPHPWCVRVGSYALTPQTFFSSLSGFSLRALPQTIPANKLTPTSSPAPDPARSTSPL